MDRSIDLAVQHSKEGLLLCFVKNPVADIGPYQLGLFVIFSHVSSKPLSLNPQQGRAQLANTGEKWWKYKTWFRGNPTGAIPATTLSAPVFTKYWPIIWKRVILQPTSRKNSPENILNQFSNWPSYCWEIVTNATDGVRIEQKSCLVEKFRTNAIIHTLLVKLHTLMGNILCEEKLSRKCCMRGISGELVSYQMTCVFPTFYNSFIVQPFSITALWGGFSVMRPKEEF